MIFAIALNKQKHGFTTMVLSQSYITQQAVLGSSMGMIMYFCILCMFLEECLVNAVYWFADVSSVYVGVASFKHTEENVTSFTGTKF